MLIADNVAYHHKGQREIGSIASLTKKKLIELMEKYEVEYIDLLLMESRWDYVKEHEEDTDGRGDCIRIPFDPEEQKQTSVKTTSCKCTRAKGCTAHLPKGTKT